MAKTKRNEQANPAAEVAKPPSAPKRAQRTKAQRTTTSKDSVVAERMTSVEARLVTLGQTIESLSAQVASLQSAVNSSAQASAFATPAAAVAGAVPVVDLLPGAVTLRQFMQNVEDLTLPERRKVVEAAIRMLEGLFVHLPLKRSMHGIDPIQRLKLLRRKLEKEAANQRMPSSPQAFHAEMIEIFHSLRDLHTNYVLPRAYQGYTAFLPFLLQEYFDGTPPTRRYIVTRLADGFSDPNFVRGVQVTSWNGIPIERAVEIVASLQAGSNEDARHARGLESLTLRSMAVDAPPDEDWVIIGFEADGQSRELKMPWMVKRMPFSSNAVNADGGESLSSMGQAGTVMGYDGAAMALQRAKKSIFFPSLIQTEQQMATILDEATGADLDEAAAQRSRSLDGSAGSQLRKFSSMQTAAATLERAAQSWRKSNRASSSRALTAAASMTSAGQDSSLLPEFFSFRKLAVDGKEFGYIRIYSFMAGDANAFVAEFIRMAKLLPASGLVIDVRGNGGGNINAGEMLLQVLSNKPITPENFHFINTQQTLKLCQQIGSLRPWLSSIDMAIETAEVYSQGFPLTPPAAANSGLWKYPGKSLLIIDSLCYSTTDIFAAGFQDHEIGPVLGTSSRTGAGGANVWTYDLFNWLPGFDTLPKFVNFRTAIRRSTRVAINQGVPLEDLGVKANVMHQLTRNDILNDNADLFKKAAGILFA